VTPTKTQTVIDLVHRLDELHAHRAKVIAELDAELATVMRELAKLTGEAPKPSANGGNAPKAPPQGALVRTRSAQELELVAVQPAPRKASFADLALDAIRANPKIATVDLAKLLYGDDSAKARDKARAVTYFLATKAEKIRRTPDDAAWEVIGLAS
jgi:hypothetical protein